MKIYSEKGGLQMAAFFKEYHRQRQEQKQALYAEEKKRVNSLGDIVNSSLKYLHKNSTLDEIKETIDAEIFIVDYEITHADYIYIFDNVIYSLERL